MSSTGPITEAGKAVSRMNALKTGIHASGEVVLPTEKIENLQLLTEEYYDHYAPTDPVQRALVDTLINSEWLLRRFRRIEGDILNRTCRIPDALAIVRSAGKPGTITVRASSPDLQSGQATLAVK